MAEVRKKSSKKSSKKKFEKMFEKMFEKKFAKKVRKYYKLSEGRGGEGWGGEGGELSFQCLRPSTSLMAAGKKITINNFDSQVPVSTLHNKFLILELFENFIFDKKLVFFFKITFLTHIMLRPKK
jgi:hypothetical protein